MIAVLRLAPKERQVWREWSFAKMGPKHDPLAYVDAVDEARVALSRLPIRQANILRMMAFEGLTCYDVARYLHCHPEAVFRIVRKARAKLRRAN